MSKKDDQYAEALRQLEWMKENGHIDQAGYEIRRAGLIEESNRMNRRLPTWLVVILSLIVAFLLFRGCAIVLG